MATIGSSYLSLIDAFKQEGGVGMTAGLTLNVLTHLNPIMQDAITTECNSGLIHRHSIISTLPEVVWGRLYQGVPQSKSGRTTVDDTTGYIEGLSTVAQGLLELANNPAALRDSEARAFLESMSQKMQTAFFYGNVALNPEQIKGMAVRYGALGGPMHGNNIVDGGGTGSDNTSIYIVTWGDGYTTMLHPKGTRAGVIREDKQSQRVLDANGNPYYAKEEYFKQHLGVAVGDWRNNVRIANIDVSDMKAGNVDLYGLMRSAYYRLQSRRNAQAPNDVPALGRTVIYCNRDVLEALDALATNNGANDSFVRLRPMELQGMEIPSYRGLPIRESDGIINAEARVV